MPQKITLCNWPMTVMGGPALNNTNDSIIYARLAFISPDHLLKLKIQLINLIDLYDKTRSNGREYLDSMLKIASHVQFCKEAMREVVKVRFFAFTHKIFTDQIDEKCPFCDNPLCDHMDFGNCPIEWESDLSL